jgi:lysophospholipase L1-like esterase
MNPLIIGAIVGLAAMIVSKRARRMSTVAPSLGLGSIGLIGDSLAVGLKAPLAKIANERGVTFRADVRGGTNAGQWLNIIDRFLHDGSPEVLLISLGTNDAAVPGNSPLFIERASKLVSYALDHGSRVAWIMPPPMPWSLVDVERGIAKSGGGRIDPPDNLPRAPDRIHSTVRGYEEWAQAIWKAASD